MICLGAISGTSMDGVDVIAAEFTNARFVRLIASSHRDYEAGLREYLLSVARDEPPLTAREWCRLDAAIADAFADAVLDLLTENQIDTKQVAALGSHGQTLFHDASAEPRISWQVGDPNRIAARTGVDVVADFRRSDLALGGQGAPLVPGFHHAQFATADEVRCVLNLGGIANVTLLPDAQADRARGFDTGPANGLLDEWAAKHGQGTFDAEGRFAERGKVDEEVLGALLAESYFSRPTPKSCGRGEFNLSWAYRQFPALDRIEPADVQASFVELTVRSIVRALDDADFTPDRLIACGGGVRNPQLMSRLARSLPGVALETSAAHGIDPQWMEACAFAWLAARTLEGLPGNLPSVTGASRPAILGGIYAR